MPQGNVERRLQRVVEDRIARAVGEIGENDGVFLGQAACCVERTESKARRDQAATTTTAAGTRIFQSFFAQLSEHRRLSRHPMKQQHGAELDDGDGLWRDGLRT